MEAVSTLVLRTASIADGPLLYDWRSDPLTRAASHQTGPVDLATHLAWLASALANPRREIYIAEEDGLPIGTVRIDREPEAAEISWTVAPSARGRGLGARMVALAAASVPGRIRAEVKRDNHPSIRIAEAAGMQLDREDGGILHFCRGPLPCVP